MGGGTGVFLGMYDMRKRVGALLLSSMFRGGDASNIDDRHGAAAHYLERRGCSGFDRRGVRQDSVDTQPCKLQRCISGTPNHL